MFYNDPLEISKERWAEILADNSVTEDLDLKILKIVYESKNHETTGSRIAAKLNFSHHVIINTKVVQFSKRIIEKTKVQPPSRADGKVRWWHVPFLGCDKKSKGFSWIMRPELVLAFEELFDKSNVEFIDSGEITIEETPEFFEGAVKKIFVNSYERDREARSKCISHYGSNCSVCGFNFEEIYGPIGKGKIHVHHLIPLSKIKKEYKVDPIKILRPVCPNCHLIIHSKKEPFTIEEVNYYISKQKTIKGYPIRLLYLK